MWSERRPDGILLNEKRGQIILLEFTRCAGHTLAEVQAAQKAKVFESHHHVVSHVTLCRPYVSLLNSLYSWGHTVPCLAEFAVLDQYTPFTTIIGDPHRLRS